MPSVRARLPETEMSVRKSCAPAICSALPTPVTQRHTSSCPNVPDMPQPTMPGAGHSSPPVTPRVHSC